MYFHNNFHCVGEWHPYRFFQSSRGLRQGDPLLPYFFVIEMEMFSGLLMRAMDEGFLSGCRVKSRSGEGLRFLICYLLMTPWCSTKPHKIRWPIFAGCLCGLRPSRG